LIAASAGLTAAVGLTVLHDVPASAAPADLLVQYLCKPTGPKSTTTFS
jgi:hypothetical protein